MIPATGRRVKTCELPQIRYPSRMPDTWDSIVVGGGAAGFFGAITCAETLGGSGKVLILEKTKNLLAKVKVSGGGRCNVTHDCHDAKDFSTHYPRGERSLIGPLSRWSAEDTIRWFEDRGVELKTEPDGRMFPTTDDSQTIIDCLYQAASDSGVEIRTGTGATAIERIDDDTDGARFLVSTGEDEPLRARNILLATGGTRLESSAQLARDLGHSLQPPVPSLFTFKTEDLMLLNLQGLSVPQTKVSIPSTTLSAEGPLLVTHWGLSGPGILRLSAWGARELAEIDYRFELAVNWLPDRDIAAELTPLRTKKGARLVAGRSPFEEIPRRLWERLVLQTGIADDCPWSRLSRSNFARLVGQLADTRFQIDGKSLNKEEFVTCGGAALSEISLKTMESKLVDGLHFAGEIMDIDGLTGGFNFQNAWCSGHHAGVSMAEKG